MHSTVEAARSCAWCGSSLAGSEIGNGRAWCRNCGVGNTAPWPSPEELAAAYDRAYRPPEGRFIGPADVLLRRLRGSLARRLDDIAPPGPILDVGAGDGALIDALAARGREAVGLERDARHDRIRAGDIEDESGEWAAVVFWHSLEHLDRPGAAIDHAAGLLTEGG